MSLQLAPYAAYKALIGRREAFFEVREDDFKEDVDKSVIPNAFGKHWNQDTWHAIQIAQISNKTQETGFWIRVADSLVRMVCHRSFYPFFTQVLHGEYFIPRLPLRNMRVVDIGANTGAYTVFMLRDYGLTWTYDSITCYEPNPDNFACLKHNVEAVGKAIELPKIELVRKAVSSITDAKLRLPKGGNFGSWSLYGSEESSETTIEVETIHPSAIPDCDMLKIDAEMAEIDILTHFLKRPSLPIFVFLEYHSMELFLQQFNLMGELFLPYRISQKAISQGTMCWLNKSFYEHVSRASRGEKTPLENPRCRLFDPSLLGEEQLKMLVTMFHRSPSECKSCPVEDQTFSSAYDPSLSFEEIREKHATAPPLTLYH